MSKRKHQRADDGGSTMGSSAPVPEQQGLIGFPGPGYTGFTGSVGYHGSGLGGVSGGYAGTGYSESSAWQPPAETRHDDRIHDDVTARLQMSPDVDANGIEVSVEAGVVTLSGNVESRHMKHIARDIAQSVPGVASVHNRLHVEQGLLDELRDKLTPHRHSRAR